MANQTVCDFCEDSEPLEPKTGMYVLAVQKVTKVDDEGSRTYTTIEYDACGACMERIRKATPRKAIR
jgi:hypothetical protein